jgi:hypothetical protein
MPTNIAAGITHMKTHLMKVLLAVLVASVAFAAPADAASKKKKKTYHRTQVGAMHYNQNGSYNVYFGNELVGRDPDPSIRAFMRRSGPQPWDGPE